jgi:hypothetical protein
MMSNAMQGMPPQGMPPQGMPPQGMPQGGGALRATESMLNPQDMARKATAGEISPQTTVRDFLGQMGIDVDGPVSQLQGVMRNQAQNATMLGKAQTLRGGAGNQPMQRQVPGPVGGPPTGRGLDELLRNR